MSTVYILDACSLIALLTNEEGSEIVKNLLEKTQDNEYIIKMHKVNLFEVYYYIYRRYGEQPAKSFIEDIKTSSIQINSQITDDIFIIAGRLKSMHKLSLADSIGIAEAVINDGIFVTADHHELDIVEEKEKIKIQWIRDKK